MAELLLERKITTGGKKAIIKFYGGRDEDYPPQSPSVKLNLPDSPTSPRRWHIATIKKGDTETDGEAVILPEDCLDVYTRTRDCASLAVWNGSDERSLVALAHIGRDSLHGLPDAQDSTKNVISNLVQHLIEQGYPTSELHAYLFGAISAWHFNNERHPEIVEHFRRTFPGSIGTSFDGQPTIDLRRVALLELSRCGLFASHITVDHDICPFTHPACASKRANKAGQNFTMVGWDI